MSYFNARVPTFGVKAAAATDRKYRYKEHARSVNHSENRIEAKSQGGGGEANSVRVIEWPRRRRMCGSGANRPAKSGSVCAAHRNAEGGGALLNACPK